MKNIIILIYWCNYRETMVHVLNYIKKHPVLLLLIVPAFLIYMLVILPSGSYYCLDKTCGIFFWGVHGFDGIWHLAISNVSFNSFPFVAPSFFGERLIGYNYLFDLITHTISLLGIPTIITYFKVFPIVWFFVFTGLLIVLAKKINNKPSFVFFLLLFSYFAGSFSYFFTLYKNGSIWGSSSLLSTLIIHSMSNLQFAFSLPILLLVLILIKDKKPDYKTIVYLGVLNFINLGIKFYGGAITSFVIFFYIVANARKKTIYSTFKYLVVFGVLSALSILLFYDPFSSIKSGAIFSISPFALIHPITEDPSLFYNKQLTNARYFLISKGIGPKLIMIEGFNLLAFLFFYLGVRFLSFFYIIKKILKRNFDGFSYNLLFTSLFAIALSSLLVQKGEWWNVIQFFFYATFILTIFLSMFAEELWNNKSLILKMFVGFLIILAIPTTIDVVKQYSDFSGGSYISKQELGALDFLKKQPNGIVLTPLYDPSLKSLEGHDKLYRAEDSAYVSAFTGKQTYFASAHPLRLMGISVAEREMAIRNNSCQILNRINYIYQVHLEDLKQNFSSCSNKIVKPIFSNDEVTIFKVAN